MKRFALPALALAALLPAVAFAQQFSKDDNAALMRLGNDLYGAGNFLTITEAVADDLFVTGNQIAVQADVGGDVHAAGSSISLQGTIGDDARIAGGNVTVNGTVRGDLLVFGGTVYVAPGSVIEGNILAAGGTIRIEGTVRGTLKVNGGEIALTGTTGGNADVRGDRVRISGSMGGDVVAVGTTLAIDPATQVGGDLRYWTAEGEQTVTATVAGSTVFDEQLRRAERGTARERAPGALAGFLGVLSLFALFSAALTIGVFQLATRTFFIDAALALRKQTGFSLLWGVLYFLVTPLIILLLLITLIGIPLAVALALCYVISLLFAQVLTAMVLARWAEVQWPANKRKRWHPAGVFFAALGIWILLKLLWVIPVIGWLVVIVAVFAGYGALLSVKVERYKKVM